MKMDFDYLFLYRPPLLPSFTATALKNIKALRTELLNLRCSRICSQMLHLACYAVVRLPAPVGLVGKSRKCWWISLPCCSFIASLFLLFFFLRGQVSVARAGCSPSVIAAHIPPSCWGPGSGRAVSDTGAGEKQQRQKDIPSYLSPGDESAPRLIPTLFKNKPTYFC